MALRDQDDVAVDLEVLAMRAKLTKAERELLREAARLLRKSKTRGVVDTL